MAVPETEVRGTNKVFSPEISLLSFTPLMGKETRDLHRKGEYEPIYTPKDKITLLSVSLQITLYIFFLLTWLKGEPITMFITLTVEHKEGDRCPSCVSMGRKLRDIGMLKLRNGKFGNFLGCSRYPICKYNCKVRIKKSGEKIF